MELQQQLNNSLFETDENMEMSPIGPNPNHQNQDQDQKYVKL